MTVQQSSWPGVIGMVALCLCACVPDAELTDERSDNTAATPFPPPPGGAAQIAGKPAPDDGMPPHIQQLVVDPGACVHVAVLPNKAAKAHLRFTSGSQTQMVEAELRSDGWLEAFTPLETFTPQTEGGVAALLEDAQGRTAVSGPQTFISPPARAPLIITEVMANPAGSEYTQEYVELLNAGEAPLSLMGFTIEDASAADVLPSVVLAPHAYALLVADAFDETGGGDVAPSAGTLIIRVAGRLGRDGLTNGGEAVSLRDATGAVVSQFPGLVDMSATAWNGRSAHRVPPTDPCDRPLLWTERPQPPSPGW